MPIIGDKSEMEASQSGGAVPLLKLLLIGDAKAGKTDYALQIANSGYNVLYIDGDVAMPTIKSMLATGRLTRAAADRIAYLDVSDYQKDGEWVTLMADFWKDFSTSKSYRWNDSKGRPYSNKDYAPTDAVWELRPSLLGPDTVMVFDSWTAYAQSVMQWKATSINEDLAELEKIGREVYAGVGNKLTQSLQTMRAMPCHVVVIAHPDEFVKLSYPQNAKPSEREKLGVVEWSKMVPKSSSRPHSLTMAKNFTDVAWLELNASNKRRISMVPSNSRVVGGHFDDAELAEKRTLADLIAKIGGQPPANPDEDMTRWLKRYAPGEFQAPGLKPAPVLGAPASPTPAEAQPAKPAIIGLGGLLSKSKAQAAS